jgi:hypothetical protein
VLTFAQEKGLLAASAEGLRAVLARHRSALKALVGAADAASEKLEAEVTEAAQALESRASVTLAEVELRQAAHQSGGPDALRSTVQRVIKELRAAGHKEKLALHGAIFKWAHAAIMGKALAA